MQHSRKGDFSRAAVKGKHGIELGAGPGLAGMAFCLLGGDVLLTDLPDIMPLLSKNVDANLSAAALRGKLENRLPDMQTPSGSLEFSLPSQCISAEIIISCQGMSHVYTSRHI